MPRPVKCVQCGIFGNKEEMTKNSILKYCHKDSCLEQFETEKEYKRIEREKQTRLAEKIAEVHGLDSIQLIPKQIYPLIEDIRNDSQLFGKLKKQYKRGIPYEAIEYTYEFCREKISWARDNKEFKNKLSELKYALAIVRNNLADAKAHSAKIQRQKESTIKLVENIETLTVVTERMKDVQSTKKLRKHEKDKLDLASLFD